VGELVRIAMVDGMKIAFGEAVDRDLGMVSRERMGELRVVRYWSRIYLVFGHQVRVSRDPDERLVLSRWGEVKLSL